MIQVPTRDGVCPVRPLTRLRAVRTGVVTGRRRSLAALALPVALLAALHIPAAAVRGDLIPEPDAIFYGRIGIGGMPVTEGTVTLQRGSDELDRYAIGSLPEAGTFYVVRARLFYPTAGDPPPADGALIGETVRLLLDGEPRMEFTITERGMVTEFNITDGTPLPTLTATTTAQVFTSTPTRSVTATPTGRTPTRSATATATATGTPGIGTPSATAGNLSPTPTPTRTPQAGTSSLIEPIDEAQTTIPVADVSIFPDHGLIRIGDELIEYDGKTLTGPEGGAAGGGPVAGRLENAVRGALGTTATAHGAGSVVSIVPSCIGDCGGDGVVTVNELIVAVNIALGNRPVTDCAAIDRDNDGTVSVAELVSGVLSLLNGCP